MEVDIKLNKEIAELSKQMNKIGWDYRFRVTHQATGAIVREARKAAKNTTAFKDHTGKLRKSIGMRQIKGEGKWHLRATARHAHLVALGTKYMPARPFLRPAAFSSLSDGFIKATKTIKRELKKYEKKYGKR